MQARIAEIQSFLQHRDHSLAVRRMLDLSFDSADQALLLKTIAWSRHYRSLLKKNPEPPDSFFEEGNELLHSIAQLQSPAFEVEELMNAQAVSKTYTTGQFKLHPINLTVHSGEVIGIVGKMGMERPRSSDALPGS